jgi:hypothetical protein
MTNLTSPAASAAIGLPKTNDMADVIDSLKRLERIGSENSKTTEKLLTAARDLSELIVRQFLPGVGQGVTVATIERKNSLGWADDTSYWVGPVGKNLLLTRNNVPVWDNRSVALEFSKDVADGLLDRIIETLTERAKNGLEGLGVIEAAVEFMKPKFEDEN